MKNELKPTIGEIFFNLFVIVVAIICSSLIARLCLQTTKPGPIIVEGIFGSFFLIFLYYLVREAFRNCGIVTIEVDLEKISLSGGSYSNIVMEWQSIRAIYYGKIAFRKSTSQAIVIERNNYIRTSIADCYDQTPNALYNLLKKFAQENNIKASFLCKDRMLG